MEILPCERHGVLNGHGGRPLTLWIIGDPHYLSPSLFDAAAASFQRILPFNSGKLIEAIPDLMSDFFSRARSEKPDAVLVPGDLTLNGELAGLRELAAELHRLQEDGIPVFAIPGNHDIDCRYAWDLTGDSAAPADAVHAEDFRTLIGPFGYDNSISHATDSLSWITPVCGNLWIMGLDSDTKQYPGGITEPTLHWAEEQLAAAQEQGVTVITMTHHNVLVQSPFMEKGYVLQNRREAAELLKRMNVTLNISGHVHMQHCSSEDGLTDIATESVSLFPLGFAVLEIEAGHQTWNYRREYFRRYQDAALQRMFETTGSFLAGTLSQFEADDREKERMLKTGQEACTAVFAGWKYTPSDAEAAQGAALWKAYGSDTFWGRYIISAIDNEHIRSE